MVKARCTVSLQPEKPWRMFSYDGAFPMTNKMDTLFDTMGEEETWMKVNSVLGGLPLCSDEQGRHCRGMIEGEHLFPGDLFVVTTILIRKYYFFP